MRNIPGYLKEYAIAIDKRVLLLASLFIAIAIFINYHFDLNDQINTSSLPFRWFSWYMIFLLAFQFPYLLTWVFGIKNSYTDKKFRILVFIAPILFAWKMAFEIHFHFSNIYPVDSYWNMVIYWPFKLLIITLFLLIIWKVFDKDQPFYSTSTKDFNAAPYFLMLLFMMPLIALASTQSDFLHVYPKLKNVSYLSLYHKHNIWYKLLFELSYGSDFFSIELFFRGFLIMAFTKWAGRNAILPMACFYCIIHFGKPLGECISSYFGGLILGVITYHTKTIYGGLIVHLGIAWMMELGGYIGNNF
ncbi:MAG: CPBP family intramembrane glutamic endopeptidase [Flavisolibacter sp.]